MDRKVKILLSCFLFSSLISNNIFPENGFPSFRKRINQVSQKNFDESDIIAEVSYGKEMSARILGIYPLHSVHSLNAYVAYLGQGISSLTGRNEISYNFAVLDSEDVNAYSAPGGNIFITRGAIELMDNEAQLVGVLAHEMGHVDHKHMVKKLKIRGQNSLLATGLANMIGGTDNTYRIVLGKLMDQGIETLFSEGFPKDDEFESDATSIKTLVNLNYDWKAYTDYLLKVQKIIEKENQQGKNLQKTHPPMKNRIHSIQKFVENNNLQDVKGRKNEERFKKFVRKI